MNPNKIRGTLAPLSELRAASKAARKSGDYEKRLIKFDEPFLARHVGPLRPGHVMVVGARTNVGKSHFLLRSMRSFSGSSLYLSLEDDVEEIVQRSDDSTPDVDRRLIVSRPFPYTVPSILSHIRECKERFVWEDEPWIVTLDYIQLLVGEESNQPATYAIQSAIAELRAAGEELGFATIMAAQVLRPSKDRKRGDKDTDDEETLPPRPSRHDLKDSGSIENAATVIVLLHGGPMTNWTAAWVDKHKSAKSGGKCLYTKGERGRLENPRLGARP